MFSIGKFSIITRLSVKMLRHYHEIGLLVPDHVDDDSNYRYYSGASVERANLIRMLRDLDFSLMEIQEMLLEHSEDEDLLNYLDRKQKETKEKAKLYREKSDRLNHIMESIRRSKMSTQTNHEVIEKVVEDMLVATHRFKGRYNEVGQAFGIVSRYAKWNVSGPAMSLYHDGEYKEEDADIEAGFPVKKEIRGESITCHTIRGGRAVTLIHRGPYERLGESYEKIMKYISDRNLKTDIPIREIYHRGPGMFFRGNPEKYITEIQFLISDE